MTNDWPRLAEAVRNRRLALRMSQLDVAHAGGPSDTTVSKIENQTGTNFAAATINKLDRALEWEAGSAARVLGGGDPTPIGYPKGRLTSADLMARLRGVDPSYNPESTVRRRAAPNVPQEDSDEQVLVPKLWLAKLLVLATELDRHRQFAAREILWMDDVEDLEGFSSDLETLLARTRSLIDQVESGVVDSLGGLRSAAYVLQRAGISTLSDLYADDTADKAPTPTDGIAMAPQGDPPSDGEAGTRGTPISEPHGGHAGVGEAKDPLWQEYDETKSQSPQEM